VASAAALGSLALYFLGVIHDYWIGIVAGSYAVGFLATPESRNFESSLNAEMGSDEIAAALGKLVSDIKPLVPQTILGLVESIRQSIVSILPTMGKGNAAVDQNTYTIRQTALEYLPQTLQRYLSLPPAYRNTFPVQDGKTATQLLVEQLTLLDGTMKKIVANFLADDTQALLANGRFLADKFQPQDFLKAV
jgi:hypothetical protein